MWALIPDLNTERTLAIRPKAEKPGSCRSQLAYCSVTSVQIGDQGLYVQLDESEPRFDGNVAQRHLTKRLGMLPKTPAEDPETAELFQQWLNRVADLIIVASRGPVFLLPPDP